MPKLSEFFPANALTISLADMRFTIEDDLTGPAVMVGVRPPFLGVLPNERPVRTADMPVAPGIPVAAKGVFPLPEPMLPVLMAGKKFVDVICKINLLLELLNPANERVMDATPLSARCS